MTRTFRTIKTLDGGIGIHAFTNMMFDFGSWRDREVYKADTSIDAEEAFFSLSLTEQAEIMSCYDGTSEASNQTFAESDDCWDYAVSYHKIHGTAYRLVSCVESQHVSISALV